MSGCPEMEFVLNDFTLKSVKYLFTWSTERIDRVFRIVLLAVCDMTLKIVMNGVGYCQKN